METDDLERWDIPREVRARMVEIARQLRRRSTGGERVLWMELRRKQVGQRKFRRQQPVGAFVLDFYCSEERLAVEVDGGVHNDPEQATLDAERQLLIEDLGIRFVRLPDELVKANPGEAVRRVEAAFKATTRRDDPSPRVGGGGRRPGEGSTA